MPKFMYGKEEQDCKTIKKSTIELLKVERITPYPCHTGYGSCKYRKEKQQDMQPIALWAKKGFDGIQLGRGGGMVRSFGLFSRLLIRTS